MRKLGAAILLLLLVGVLIYGASDLPAFGDKSAPLHSEMSVAYTDGASHYYVNNAYDDAHTPNFITVVLADYRSFDTLGETIVVLIAGLGSFLILSSTRKKKGEDS